MSLPAWNTETLKQGFLRFYKENGHYPSAHEIDRVKYLPTSRSIQRTYGGLVSLRKTIGLDKPELDQTKGEKRSITAKLIQSRSKNLEESFYHHLLAFYPEVLVHEQKTIRLGNKNIRPDFFVYTNPDSNDMYDRGYIIDIFCPTSTFSLNSIIRYKTNLYKNVRYKTYLIIIGKTKYYRQPTNNNKETNHIIVATEVDFFTSIINDLSVPQIHFS